MKYYTKASKDNKPTIREKENFNVAYRAACESIVLLENDGVLPLCNKTVALFGNGAKRTVKGGTGSGEVNERHSVNILEGLENAGFTVTTHRWIEDYEQLYVVKEKEFNDNKLKKFFKNPTKTMELMEDFGGCAARKVSQKDIDESNTDTCVYVIARQAGEGVDRRAKKGDMYLTDEEYADIKFCAEKYKNFVLIINAGSQIDMKFTQEIDGINAIMFICQLGTAGGNAVADTLSGKVNPSGKLADTWAKTYSDIPFYNEYSYLNGNLDDEYYKEDIFVGYRYFDSFDVEPKYCFGYGKSYTDFEIKTENVALNGTEITVTASVKNTGNTYSGKEVVQVYLSAPCGKLYKEYQSLAGFAKTNNIAPNETDTVTVTFDLKNHSSYDESTAQFILEKGEYIVRVGNSSRNTQPAAVVVLDNDAIVSQHQNICPVKEKFEILSNPTKQTEKAEDNITKLYLSADIIKTEKFVYKTPEVCSDKRVQEFMSKLSIEDMVEIVVGIGMYGGERRFDMPGSVGNTTSKFWDKGLANSTLCDGPAGVRISQRAALTPKGNTKMMDLPLSAFKIIPKFIQKAILADPEKSNVVYQYTTAFPVSAAMAQTFNTDMVTEVGKAVYREMKEYGCVYWLAPALNIHRNPLCGRNFEYYSEDPFLSGVMATAMTKGVQQEEGFYVTLKHFAANNQEDNRKRVSSNMSERALREIYLRGFEMAVKAGAKSVMTSYNLLNGVYTPNSYDLCTKVLRNEWGFDGVVMTDWFSTSKGCAENELCMTAGNDLIMPGGKTERKDIIKAVKEGKISQKSIQRCCANVVKYIFDSQIQKEYIDNK